MRKLFKETVAKSHTFTWKIVTCYSNQGLLDIDNSKNIKYFLDRRNHLIGQFDTFITSEQVINFFSHFLIGAKLSSYFDYTGVLYSVQSIISKFRLSFMPDMSCSVS